MNILLILGKEVKQNLRNFKGMTMMILFPIVLTLILGSALSGMFDSSSQFKDIEVIYNVQGENAFTQAFHSFVQKGQDMGIKFTEAQNVEQGLDNIKNGKFACFIKTDNDGMELIKNDRYALKGNLVESILSTFLQRYKAISAVAMVTPAAVDSVAPKSINMDNVKITSVGEKKQPRAMDYYAVSMITLIILYSSLTGSYAIKNEKTGKTENRLLVSPVRRYEILSGKILGTLLITLLQISIVFLFSKYFLKTYWGSHIGIVLGLVVAEVVMAVSLGIGIAFMVKNEMAVSGILNIMIPFIAFLGGGYIPLENFGETMQLISDISPLRWVNKAIFQVIYSNDFSSVALALTINLGLAALFILIASISIRKEASSL